MTWEADITPASPFWTSMVLWHHPWSNNYFVVHALWVTEIFSIKEDWLLIQPGSGSIERTGLSYCEMNQAVEGSDYLAGNLIIFFSFVSISFIPHLCYWQRESFLAAVAIDMIDLYLMAQLQLYQLYVWVNSCLFHSQSCIWGGAARSDLLKGVVVSIASSHPC